MLNIEDFADMFGTSLERISAETRKIISEHDFTHRVLVAEERKAKLQEATAELERPLRVAGRHRIGDWEDGWAENLSDFVEQGFDLGTLMPKFMQPGRAMRLEGQYIVPTDLRFEINLVSVLRHWLFGEWFKPVDNVYEFGCGTAHNLVALAQQFPEKQLHGLDWARSSQEIISKIVEHFGYNISGGRFDLLTPDSSYRLEPDSGVFTTGTLEQLGSSFEPFLQYLLDSSPAVCVHLETIYELYDQDDPFDLVAARYLEKRGYLNGFLTRLRELEGQGIVEILEARKTFGSSYHDSYGLVVWRPVSRAITT